METHHGLPVPRASPEGCAAVFGSLDGVHSGHRALITAAMALGRCSGLHGPLTAVTFDPHPLALLGTAPRLVDTLELRLRWLEAAGVERAVILPFDAGLASRSAEDFLANIMARAVGARALAVGAEARFGRGGSGNAELAIATGRALGLAVVACPPVELGGARVSSSRVRALVAAGAVEDAAILLGREFCLVGDIEGGDGLGRGLGFPTLNLRPAPSQIQPGSGVYAAIVECGTLTWPAAVHIGPRPTLGAHEPRVEAHLIDWHGEVSAARLLVHLCARVRSVRGFASTSALRAQIAEDVERCRLLLARRSTPRPGKARGPTRST